MLFQKVFIPLYSEYKMRQIIAVCFHFWCNCSNSILMRRRLLTLTISEVSLKRFMATKQDLATGERTK